MAPNASSDVAPNAKQLVFLFMAATVVAVVVFLCGVLVGRGVPLRPVGAQAPVGVASTPRYDDRPAVIERMSREPSAAAAESAGLTYPERLESTGPIDEPLRSTEGSATEGSSQPIEPPSALGEPLDDEGVATMPDPAPPVSAPAASGRGAEGFKIQVGAYRVRGAAQQVANALTSKGFPAYVLEPSSDAPIAVYRVRVGPYAERGEAERVRQRLEQEEQFKVWVTR